MTGHAEKLVGERRMLAVARRVEQNMFDALIRAIDEDEDEALIKLARRTLAAASAAVDEIEARMAVIAVTLH
jgi:hypothetical protein